MQIVKQTYQTTELVTCVASRIFWWNGYCS